ncbi:MAG: hypothetical protein R3E48_08580 [Burkholderiaceae bacterium]
MRFRFGDQRDRLAAQGGQDVVQNATLVVDALARVHERSKIRAIPDDAAFRYDDGKESPKPLLEHANVGSAGNQAIGIGFDHRPAGSRDCSSNASNRPTLACAGLPVIKSGRPGSARNWRLAWAICRWRASGAIASSSSCAKPMGALGTIRPTKARKLSSLFDVASSSPISSLSGLVSGLRRSEAASLPEDAISGGGRRPISLATPLLSIKDSRGLTSD